MHKSGVQNTNADALSRIGSVGALEGPTEVISDQVKKQVLYEFHDSPLGGHKGMNKTYRAISSRYTWPKMRREIEEYVKQCKSCQTNKILTPRNKVPMQATTTAEHTFEKCYMDVVGPLPVTTRGHKYILTFQDDVSSRSSRSNRKTGSRHGS